MQIQTAHPRDFSQEFQQSISGHQGREADARSYVRLLLPATYEIPGHPML
jgi:hypothetical protein